MSQNFSKDTLQADYEDAYFRLLMSDYARTEGEDFLCENEVLKKDPEYQITPLKLRKYQRTINNALRSRSIKDAFTSAYRTVNKVAAVFILVLVLMFTTVMSVEALRVRFINMLIGFENEYTSVQFADEYSDSIISGNINVEWTDAYMPAYVPDGFKVVKLSNEHGYKYIDYAHDDGRLISYYEMSAMYESNIDTEGAQRVDYSEVQGLDALFIEKDGKLTLTWATEDRMFIIIAEVSENEIYKIAESVQFMTP